MGLVAKATNKRKGQGQQMIEISVPKVWDKNIALAVLDTWIYALDNGYDLVMITKENNEVNA